MTFSKILKLIEDYGAIGSLTPNGQSNVRVNGEEYAKRGVKSKWTNKDGITVDEINPSKTPEELFGKKSKST